MERNTRIEEELFPFYALDALTEEERAEVEQYVAANPDASYRLAELTTAVLDFSAATPPITPSPTIKAGLMARIAAEAAPPKPAPARPIPVDLPRRAAPSRPRNGLWDFFFGRALVFTVLLLFLGAFGLWRLSQQSNNLRAQLAALEERAAGLEGELDLLRATNEELRAELTAREDQLAAYLSPGAVTIAIGDATGEHPTAHGTLTVDPATETATLRVANLPPSEDGSTYQAWLIVDETPLSVGTFTIDESGTRTHTITESLPDSFDAIGISLEPEGGSESPTPDNIILFGSSF